MDNDGLSSVSPRVARPSGDTEAVILIIPVLHRPHRVEPLINSIEAATPREHRTLFIVDPDDDEEREAIERHDGLYAICAGNYATKINYGADITAEPLIFTGADDLEFHDGWLEAAESWLLTSDAMVAGTNDLCNPKVIAGEHATHFLVRREYLKFGTIDEGRKLLHEGYQHEYVDNEFIETAKHRGVYVQAGDSIVEHLHPMAGKAPMDDLYAASTQRMVQGAQLYGERKALWNG